MDKDGKSTLCDYNQVDMNLIVVCGVTAVKEDEFDDESDDEDDDK